MPERATVVNRSKKSAEAIVAARRRAEREGELEDMPLGQARHQKPGQLGRRARRQGEAEPEAGRDEAWSARQNREGSGRADLLRQALARENLVLAWKRVKANRGSAGVDGLSIDDTAEYLKTHWSRIRAELFAERYRPQPVRRVQIPKPNGGMRELGIPTVTDRLIQQALLQVLQPRIDPTFSEHSYGFRPGRRAHDAVLQAQRYVQDGYRIVVDVDRLHLKVNEAKSAVTSAFGRKFLGYSLWLNPWGHVRRVVAAPAIQAFKRRIRQITRRTRGRSLSDVVADLRRYLPGWKAYFRLAQTSRVFRGLDEWLRRRLRALQLKHWRRGITAYRALRAMGARRDQAAAVAAGTRRWWHTSLGELHKLMPIAYFDRLGVPRLS